MPLTLSDKDIKELRRVRSAAVTFLRALDGIDLDRAPEKPRKRQNLKDQRVEEFERMYALGRITKPKDLKSTKK